MKRLSRQTHQFMAILLMSLFFILFHFDYINIFICFILSLFCIIGIKPCKEFEQSTHLPSCNIKPQHLDDIRKMALSVLYNDKMVNRRLEIFELLAIASKEFLCSNDPNSGKVERLLAGMVNSLNVTRGYMFKFNKQTKLFDVTYTNIINPKYKNCGCVSINENDYPIIFSKMRSNTNIVGLDDIPLSEQNIVNTKRIKTLLWIPIHVDNRFTGFMGFDTSRNKQWNKTEIETIVVVSEIFAAWCARRRLGKTTKNGDMN